MLESVDRRCEACKEKITINRFNITGVVNFQNKYYHYECFKELAIKKASAKRGKPAIWQDALNRMLELEHDAKTLSEHYFIKHDFNDWLIEKYNLSKVPGSFWQRIADLEKGIYAHRKCREISVSTLFDTWKWGWQKLNEINVRNQNSNRGPKDDEQRLIYDLSIVIQKVPSFLKHQAHSNMNAMELSVQVTNEDIDMSKFVQPKQEEKIDISDIFDDLYVE